MPKSSTARQLEWLVGYRGLSADEERLFSH
jgi:hypothetical protein